MRGLSFVALQAGNGQRRVCERGQRGTAQQSDFSLSLFFFHVYIAYFSSVLPGIGVHPDVFSDQFYHSPCFTFNLLLILTVFLPLSL